MKKSTIAVAPDPLTTLDAVGWICCLSGHTERHTLQIDEVETGPGFPAG